MTPEQIHALEGLELRAAVAREVFGPKGVEVCGSVVLCAENGWRRQREVPAYETDQFFMLVVHEMERRGCIWQMSRSEDGSCYAAFGKTYSTMRGGIIAETLPVAVCRAALLWKAAPLAFRWP